MKIKKLLPATLFLILVSIFHKKFTTLVSTTLVEPVLSTVDTSSYWLDTLSILTGGLLIGCFLWWGVHCVRVSVKAMSWLVAFVFVYLYYRLYGTGEFLFLPFKSAWLGNIAVLDVVVLIIPSLIAYIAAMLFRHRMLAAVQKGDNRAEVPGFLPDVPIVVTQETDKFDRWHHIPELKANILATKSTETSFAIGIIGKWGTGKTSFLMGVKRLLEGHVIYMKFNPWSVQGSQNLIASFFNDLSVKLGKYDHSLREQILQYSKKLLSAYNDTALNKVKDLFYWGADNVPLREQYDRINDSIKRIGRKLVIEIDDVDRLYEDEVIEILRIIRNTANFGNTFFLVAFDRNYLISCIKRKLVDFDLTFVEKIFQLEYLLPVNNDRTIMDNSFYQKIFTYLTPDHQELVSKRNIVHNVSGRPEIFPTLSAYFSTERDVIRLRNTFLLSYEKVKHDVYFPDFLYITILKMKYPAVYHLLYYRPNVYLIGTGMQIGEGQQSYTGIYGIRFQTDQTKDLQNFKEAILYKELSHSFEKYSLSDEDVEKAVKIVHSIFPPNSGGIGFFRPQRSKKMSHMSIDHVECFDRYFDYSMQGRLQQVEYQKMMCLDIDAIKQKIDEYIKERDITNDLRVKFENETAFSTLEGFEKVITGIVHFANRPLDRSFSINNYNNDNFLRKLGGDRIDDNKVLQSLYEGNIEKYKTFLKGLFVANSALDRAGFLIYFAIWLIQHREEGFILSKEELKQLLARNFCSVLDIAEELSYELFLFYSTIIRVFVDTSQPQSEPLKLVGKGVEITEKLKKFILGKDFVGFLRNNIRFDGRTEGYSVGTWDIVILGSREVFEEELKQRKDDSVQVREYYDLYNAYKATGQPVLFKFQHFDIHA